LGTPRAPLAALPGAQARPRSSGSSEATLGPHSAYLHFGGLLPRNLSREGRSLRITSPVPSSARNSSEPARAAAEVARSHGSTRRRRAARRSASQAGHDPLHGGDRSREGEGGFFLASPPKHGFGRTLSNRRGAALGPVQATRRGTAGSGAFSSSVLSFDEASAAHASLPRPLLRHTLSGGAERSIES
jgi:hypothetical protein